MAIENEPTLAWRAIPLKAPVYGVLGRRIGTVARLLGDLEEDIFHGIAMREPRGGRTVEVPAARVRRIAADAVYTDLSQTDLVELPTYRESHRQRIAWGGIFEGHRPEWKG